MFSALDILHRFTRKHAQRARVTPALERGEPESGLQQGTRATVGLLSRTAKHLQQPQGPLSLSRGVAGRPEQTHMVHHLLEALAEGAASDAHEALLCLGKGDRPDARCHPKLLHHGVSDAGDLLQVILGPWSAGSRRGTFQEPMGHRGTRFQVPSEPMRRGTALP